MRGLRVLATSAVVAGLVMAAPVAANAASSSCAGLMTAPLSTTVIAGTNAGTQKLYTGPAADVVSAETLSPGKSYPATATDAACTVGWLTGFTGVQLPDGTRAMVVDSVVYSQPDPTAVHLTSWVVARATFGAHVYPAPSASSGKTGDLGTDPVRASDPTQTWTGTPYVGGTGVYRAVEFNGAVGYVDQQDVIAAPAGTSSTSTPAPTGVVATARSKTSAAETSAKASVASEEAAVKAAAKAKLGIKTATPKAITPAFTPTLGSTLTAGGVAGFVLGLLSGLSRLRSRKRVTTTT
jgi:hypothetical protein